MRIYALSITVGLLVGLIYGMLGVRSPAPPVVALVGLFGMLVGEQVVPVAKRLVSGRSAVLPVQSHCIPQGLGTKPGKSCGEEGGT